MTTSTADTAPTVIRTTAPIPIQELKRAFSENIVFEIDVDETRLPPKRLLNYVCNVKVPCELVFGKNDRFLELVVAYMETNLLYRCPEFETMALMVVMNSMGIDISFDGFTKDEIASVESRLGPGVIDLWRIRLSCVQVWAMYVNSTTKHLAQEWPVDTVTHNDDGDVDPRGINFIHVLDSPLLYIWVDHIRPEDVMFNKELFEGYIFSAKNMFHYLSGASNPFMLALFDLIPPPDIEDVE